MKLSQLGDEFYLIAPDYPGFGYSEKPGIMELLTCFTHGRVVPPIMVDNTILLDDGGPDHTYEFVARIAAMGAGADEDGYVLWG